MPFIVKQGSDANEVKEENLHLFEDNLKRGGYLSKGSADDLALKLYFVSTPGPFDKRAEVTTTLVGNKQFIGVDDDPSEDEDEVNARRHAPKQEKGYFEQFDSDPTVLQKLRMMRKLKGVLKDGQTGGSLLRLLKASEEKKTWVKSGRRLNFGEENAPSSSFQSVLNWALKYTELYSNDLEASFVTQLREADAFVGVYDRTKEIFERDNNRPAVSLYELAVFYSEQMEKYHHQKNVKIDATSSGPLDQQLKYHEEKRRRSVLGLGLGSDAFGSPGSPARAVTNEFASDMHYKEKIGRRKGSISPKSPCVGAALSPRAQAELSKGKMKSLGQKLDFIADDRRDEFLRSVDAFSGHDAPTLFDLKEKRRLNAGAKTAAQPPLGSKPSKSGFHRRSSDSRTSRGQLANSNNEEAGYSPNKESGDAKLKPTDGDRVTWSNPTYLLDEDDNLKVDPRCSQMKEPASPLLESRHKKPPVPRQRVRQGIIDPNKRPVSYSNGAVEDPSTMNASTKRAIALAAAKEKAFKAELDIVMMEHKEKVKKLHKLAKKGEKKQRVFMTRSEDVYEKLRSFDGQVDNESEKVKLKFEDLEIQYHSTMKTKSDAWNRNKEFKSALSDMKVVERRTKAIESFSRNAHLIAPNWFSTFSKTVKELISRSALLDPIPPSCWKLLNVFQKITMKGYEFTRERFYAMLEATVHDREVFRKVNVHKILKALRDCVGIRSEKFLNYHEQRGIQPCPELVAHIKAVHRKRNRMKHFKQNKGSSQNDTTPELKVIAEGALGLDYAPESPETFASLTSVDPGQQTITTESFTFSASNLLSPTKSLEQLEELNSDASSIASESPRTLSRAETPLSD